MTSHYRRAVVSPRGWLRRESLVRAMVYIAVLLVSGVVLVRYAKPSTPELSDLLPPDMRPTTAGGGQADELLIVAIVGRESSPPDERVRRVEAAIAATEGVAGTSSILSRPRLTLTPKPAVLRGAADGDSQLDGLMRGDGVRPILAVLDESTRSEAGAFRFAAELDQTLDGLRGPDDELLAFADPLMRAEYQKQSMRDLGWGTALILLPVVLLTMLLFGSAHAATLALLLGLSTAALTTAGQYLVDGRPSPAGAFLLPFAFSVATLDAFHLSRRHQELHQLGHPSPVKAAAAQLWRPCLFTSGTTAVGLGVLAWTSSVPLLRDTGKWAAIAAVLAFVLTFSMGTHFLPRRPTAPPRLARITSAWLRRLVVLSLRHPRRTAVAWLGLLLLSVPLVARLESRPSYPDPFVSGHLWSIELERLERGLDISTDVVQLDVSSSLPGDAGLIRAVNGTLALQAHLEGDPDVALGLGAGTFLREVRATPADLPQLAELVQRATEDDGLLPRSAGSPFVVDDATAMRTLVILSHDADRAGFLKRLDRFAASRANRVQLEVEGPRETRRRIQKLSLDHVKTSLPASIVAIFLVLLLLRGVRLAVIALVASATPLAIAAALLQALGSGWNLAMLAGATVLLAVAVDDSIHLLWPVPAPGGAAGLPRVVGLVGPALAATTIVLIGAFLAVASASIQFNRDQGLIAAIGMAIALVADLTLLPALMRLWRPSRAARATARRGACEGAP